MFESLTERLNLTFKKLKGQGKLSEANMKEGLREVRLALLEADVHYKVAKDFIEKVRDRALGQEPPSPEPPLYRQLPDEAWSHSGQPTSS